MLQRQPEWLLKEVIDNFAKKIPPMYKNIFRHSDLSTLTSAPLTMRFRRDLLFKNISKSTVTLAGNAMHPMTSDLGQSDCSALEDAVEEATYRRIAYKTWQGCSCIVRPQLEL